MITDELIRQFIDNLNEDYTFSETDIKYISNYSGCKPPVPDHAVKKVKEIIIDRFPSLGDDEMIDDMSAVSVLVSGFGADKILCKKENYSSDDAFDETSFQNEYYCYAIARALNQKKWTNGTYKIRFRDMADYFTNYKGNNLKYNLVLVTPDYTNYHHIDSDARFRNMSSFAYYTLRGFFFARPGGVVYSVVPSKYDQEIRDGVELLGNAKLNIIKSSDYSIISIEHI